MLDSRIEDEDLDGQAEVVAVRIGESLEKGSVARAIDSGWSGPRRTSSLSASECHFTATTVKVGAFVPSILFSPEFEAYRDRDIR